MSRILTHLKDTPQEKLLWRERPQHSRVCGYNIQLCDQQVAGFSPRALRYSMVINFPQVKSRQVQVTGSQPLTSAGFTIILYIFQ